MVLEDGTGSLPPYGLEMRECHPAENQKINIQGGKNPALLLGSINFKGTLRFAKKTLLLFFNGGL
jgi:hypothetical protein